MQPFALFLAAGLAVPAAEGAGSAAILADAAATGAAADTTRAARAERFEVEVRGGVSVGEVTSARMGGERKAGGAWRLGASYAPLPRLAVYAGYGGNSFGCETGFCRSQPVDFTSRGADLGVEVGAGPVRVRGGLVHHALAASWGGAESGRETTDSALGWEAGAALVVPAGQRLRVAPGVRYGTYRASFPGGGEDRVGYLTAEVGLRVALPPF